MTENELTLAIFMLECVFLFGLTFVVGFSILWKRRRDDIKATEKLIAQVMDQESLAIEKIRMQIVKATDLSYEKSEMAAKKIIAKQHMLISEIAQLYLLRNNKKLFSMQDKITSYTQTVLSIHKIDPKDVLGIGAAKEADIFIANDKQEPQFAKKFEELIAD